MTKITYEQFLAVLSTYDKFDNVILNALYQEFGKNVINNYFERYFESISEENIEKFVSTYSAYFESVSQETDIREIGEYNTNGVINLLVYHSYKFPMMSADFEKEQGLILKECNKRITIVSNLENYLELYPKLNLAKIFLSVKTEEDLKLLFGIKKIAFSYDDNSIMREDIAFIKRYLELCKNGIPSLNKLKKEFPELCFDGVSSINDLDIQVEFLKKIVYAKYNFYNRNLRLVIAFSKKYCKKYDMEEKIQEGCMGLIRAINNYDASLDCKFSTYATPWIIQYICRYVANNASIIRKPVYLHDAINRYNRYVTSYISLNGVEPSFDECISELGFSAERLREVQRESRDVLSLDVAYVGDESGDDLSSSIADYSKSIEDDLVSRDIVEFVRKEIYVLFDGREKEILLNRLGLDQERKAMTLEELGACYGITRERVRQIEHKCKRKLKVKLKDKGIDKF